MKSRIVLELESDMDAQEALAFGHGIMKVAMIGWQQNRSGENLEGVIQLHPRDGIAESHLVEILLTTEP